MFFSQPVWRHRRVIWAFLLGAAFGYWVPWRLSFRWYSPAEVPPNVVGEWVLPILTDTVQFKPNGTFHWRGSEDFAGEWKVTPKHGLCMRVVPSPTATCFHYTVTDSGMVIETGKLWRRVALHRHERP